MDSDNTIDVSVVVSHEEVIDEINEVVKALGKRTEGLSEDERQKKRTVQLLAVGALFAKWMSENPENQRMRYASIVHSIASSIIHIGGRD